MGEQGTQDLALNLDSEEPIEIENHEVMLNGLIEDLQGTVSLDFMGDSFLKDLLLDFRDEGISDIKYDGFYLIVESAKRGKYKVVVNTQIMRDVNLLLDELERLNDKVVNMKSPYLDMDVILLGSPTKLRFSVLHETLTNIKGIKSFCIRRNMFAKPVINDDNVGNMVENKPEVIEFIQDLIDINRKPNIVFSGETGSGKTEFQKYIIGQIIPQHGVVSIQDTNDAALKKLYPEKDITEIFSNRFYSLSDGIKTALRYNPEWVIVAEIRGSEIQSFVEALETGHSGITTLHASSAINTVDRMNNLAKKFGGDDISETLTTLIDYVIHLIVVFEKSEYEGKEVLVKKRVVNEIYNVKNDVMLYKYGES